VGRRFQILALSGGGYRGLFSARILEQIEEQFGAPISARFDLVSGTSIGAILALGLAIGIPAARLSQLFLEHGRHIFRPRSSLPGRGWFSSIYDNRYLRELLESEEFFGERVLGDSPVRLLIPSVNYTSGAPQIFKTAHHENFTRDHRRRMVDVAMASSAAPVFFPVYEFESQQYVDGGLVANAPGLIAVHEARHFLAQEIEDVYVLSIGTVTSQVTADPEVRLDRGARTWGKKLFELTISAQETLSKSMLDHMLGDRYLDVDVLVTEDQSASVGLDVTSDAANKVLVGRANQIAQKTFGNSAFRAFFNHKPAPPVFHFRPQRNMREETSA
jgi:patatin-like phospholipase/acyl hydrolase